VEIVDIVSVLTNAPLTAILVYLLIAEQRAHADTRRSRDEDMRTFMRDFAGLAERVVQAVERLDLPGPL
jgi:hypothetical protein